MNMKYRNTKDERGIVSIVVVVMLMIVISLIIIGFARITRREQRQALDREINTKAFYAAESGANDAVAKIKELIKAGTPIGEYTTKCTGSGSFMGDYSLNNSVDGNSSYSCLFVDPTPPGFKFANIDTNTSKIMPIVDKNDAVINSITIGWQDKNGSSDLSGCKHNAGGFASPILPDATNTASGWPATCATGVMRVDLVPVSGALTRDGLLSSSMTVFLYPSTSVSGATTMAYSGGLGNQGSIIRVRCDGSVSPEICGITISGLNATRYMLRLKSIYRSSAASVVAKNGATTLELKEGQAIVDITGKATDVLRRMQIRVPLVNFDNAPEFAAQTVDSICKRFAVAPPDYYSADTSTEPNCNVIN